MGEVVGAAAGHIDTVETDRAGRVLGEKAGDRVDEGGLAGTVRADQPGELARCTVQ